MKLKNLIVCSIALLLSTTIQSSAAVKFKIKPTPSVQRQHNSNHNHDHSHNPDNHGHNHDHHHHAGTPEDQAYDELVQALNLTIDAQYDAIQNDYPSKHYEAALETLGRKQIDLAIRILQTHKPNETRGMKGFLDKNWRKTRHLAEEFIHHLNPINLGRKVLAQVRKNGFSLGLRLALFFTTTELIDTSLVFISAKYAFTDPAIAVPAGFLGTIHIGEIAGFALAMTIPKRAREIYQTARATYLQPIPLVELYELSRSGAPIDWTLNPFYYEGSTETTADSGDNQKPLQLLVVEEGGFWNMLPMAARPLAQQRLAAQKNFFPTFTLKELRQIISRKHKTPPPRRGWIDRLAHFTWGKEHRDSTLDSHYEATRLLALIEQDQELLADLRQETKKKKLAIASHQTRFTHRKADIFDQEIINAERLLIKVETSLVQPVETYLKWALAYVRELNADVTDTQETLLLNTLHVDGKKILDNVIVTHFANKNEPLIRNWMIVTKKINTLEQLSNAKFFDLNFEELYQMSPVLWVWAQYRLLSRLQIKASDHREALNYLLSTNLWSPASQRFGRSIFDGPSIPKPYTELSQAEQFAVRQRFLRNTMNLIREQTKPYCESLLVFR